MQDDDHLDDRGAARQWRIDPTVINGGIINRYGSKRAPRQKRLVGDRGRRERWKLPKARRNDRVVTNIDPEHLEHYGDFDAVKDAFVEFIENVPFYGLAVLCVDIRRCRTSSPHSGSADRHLRVPALADVRADNVTPVPGGAASMR